ncbi:hypothetical protein HG537_0B04730 [Torulaspora globosa]|uniref:DUF676 domain-containing protein n=1 Tax=Torulaspora globosa TaxID=48254 RepID=A0A7H9HRY1_9SACH|nr:hypothetical protein HG537_0B04730 [Torulaspora sp. CBS 2947]
MTCYHLVVLVHGLWGNASHFDYIRTVLQEYTSDWNDEYDEELITYTTSLNEGFKTYDGIDVCGYRVAEEITDEIEGFDGNISKISIVGYSLGGLISRYALGLLYRRQYFKRKEIELINFTTFCTPHVGVLAPGRNLAVKVFNNAVPWLLGNSGKQMFLKDNVSSTGGQPLIYLMSLENTVFYKALESFKYRSLYANTINDKRTAWWTAGISLNDPFFNIDEFNGLRVFQYIEGFDTVVVDRTKMIVISQATVVSKDEDEALNGVELKGKNEDINVGQDFYFLNYWFLKITRWILVIVNILIIAPLLLTWKIVQSAAEITISTVRVTRFLNKYSHQILRDFFELPGPTDLDDSLSVSVSDVGSPEPDYAKDNEIYSLKSTLSRGSSIRSTTEYGTYLGLEESLNDQADYLMESVYDAIERKNTHGGVIEKAQSESIQPDENSLAVSIIELENKSAEQLTAKHGMQKEQLIKNLDLNLPEKQRAIIKSLNKLDWEKYPIYIRKTTSAHACAIVRQLDPDFEEGKLVIDHWIKNVFRRD